MNEVPTPWASSQIHIVGEDGKVVEELFEGISSIAAEIYSESFNGEMRHCQGRYWSTVDANSLVVSPPSGR